MKSNKRYFKPYHIALAIFCALLALIFYALPLWNPSPHKVEPAYSSGENAILFDWDSYNNILKTHIKNDFKDNIKVNLVDYTSLSDNQEFLEIYDRLKRYSPVNLSKYQKLAFYINAYNYFTLKIIIDNKMPTSIQDLGSIVFPIWKKEAGYIDQEQLTLDQIEHQILRPMGDPLVHFALVCASLSCPDLRKEAYHHKILDEQLEEQAQWFISNTSKGVRRENGAVYISKIFSWYEEDFEEFGGVIEFINLYREDQLDVDSYRSINYNWDLNGQ